MTANRGKDTGPEKAIRSVLHARGRRFLKHRQVLPGLRCSADVVFFSARVAVFVDGCFWHRCPAHATWPRANREWWERKFAVIVARDRRNDRVLREAGWLVVRIWEHEDPAEAADRIETALESRGATRPA